MYVGFDSKWPRRQQSHKNESSNPRSHTYYTPFHSAIRKYGWSAFSWEVIYQSLDKDHTLNTMEQFFIEQFRTHVSFDDCIGYNLTLGGEGQMGRRLSEETKAKKSKALFNRPSQGSRIISTPHGTFTGLRIAARAIGIHARTLQARLERSTFPDWFYVDGKTKKTGTSRDGKTKEISTPYGVFDSIQTCANKTGIPKSTIQTRLESPHQRDWKYTGISVKHNSITIQTPHGIFDSVAAASIKLNIPKSTIFAKLRSKKQPDWYRL